MDKNMYDVGIIGFWYGMNYGSVLTYYALYKSVERLGLKPMTASTIKTHSRTGSLRRAAKSQGFGGTTSIGWI